MIRLSPRVSAARPSAANASILTDEDFAHHLLGKFGVAVVPGSSFLAPSHFRVSIANTTDDLSRACARIHAACEALDREAA